MTVSQKVRRVTIATATSDIDHLRPVIAGVIAAPQAEDREAWLQLVATKAALKDEGLRQRLLDLEAKMRREAAERREQEPSAAERLKALRSELSNRGLDGFIVPHADEYQCEYTPENAERLAWLTGFTGSAGNAVVLAKSAAVFVDGRYTLQVAAQTDAQLYQQIHVATQGDSPTAWLKKNVKAGDRIGYDPWLHSPAERDRYVDVLKEVGAELVAVDSNPIDEIWTTQPAEPISPILPHELEFAGKSSSEKRSELGQVLSAAKVDAVVLTTADSIAWLLNIRGGDVAHSPLPLSFAIVDDSGKVELFCNSWKLAPGLKKHLGKGVKCRERQAFTKALEKLGKDKCRVQVDPQTASAFVLDCLKESGAKVVLAADPCKLPKACKNAVEIEGMRACHRRDGAALTMGLCWVKKNAASGKLTEMSVADKLYELRRQQDKFRDLSFPSIIGSGPNGAIVHYRATEESNRPVEAGTLLLLDSGAQYLDGTTDVTRTIAIGEPTAEMRDRFTRVLKGHIALGMARFPKGTNGHQLDVLARQPLWSVGLDFKHGTGHGVGSYLGVHEGPQNISTRAGTAAFAPGMVTSNEPGYYKAGAYGIRIESLIVTVEVEVPGSEEKLYGFETITLAPIDRDLIDASLLSREEREWLNAYHADVCKQLTPLVDKETADWLKEVTQPI